MNKTALLFPGQGAQSVGMGKQLFDSLPAAREVFQRANDSLRYDLAELCFSGPADKLDSTVYSQPALFVCSLAALQSLQSVNAAAVDQCQATAGLSLGEYTALVFAGALTFEDGLQLVQLRGRAMQRAAELVPGGMLSILGLELPAVEAICAQARGENEVLQVANLLCPGNIAISGHVGSLQRAHQLALAQGAFKVVRLSVAGAFHTSLMEPAVSELAAAVDRVPLRSPSIAVLSNVDGLPHDDPGEIRRLLVRQVCSPVLWENSMRWLLDRQFENFCEVGPGRVLRGLMKRIDRRVSLAGAMP